ncbi:ABC transporter permease [Nakamurella endophytica]|uniref:Transport permease protein n=1 Tax=Nakamurella endophytica TaxID=1748367 RepID=A0A917SMU8_9ACTN|nr:ABC transporter permease [Nakamurella endophytica]GGL89739.1 transport permease protein [Nakamurella endophytica]
MSAAVVPATAGRVLRQLRHDRRTVALLVLVPLLLLGLLRWMFQEEPGAFDRVAPIMVAVFPFTVMFLVTSIAMLRERTTGTLERLMTTRTRPAELIAGYALAFAVAASVQAGSMVTVALAVFGLDGAGPAAALVGVAELTALLGVGLGLLASAFSRTEFQAVQMLPVVVIPQLLLCGLFVPRESMSSVLHAVSDALPLSYAVQAIQRSAGPDTAGLWRDVCILAGCVILALALAAATMRRRTR